MIWPASIYAQSLSLKSPIGGEFWQIGKNPSILWDASNLSQVKIEFSTNNGSSWSTIATVAASSKQYDWTVPAAASTNCLVRLSSGNYVSTSAKTFQIADDKLSCLIVVLGSSTSAGTGPTTVDSAYVWRYRKAIFQRNTRFSVTNLAVGGFSTKDVIPSGDANHNITKALSLNPCAIIMNLPTNDAAYNVSVATQLANYTTIMDLAAKAGVKFWVTTTQPRNFTDASQLQNLKDMRDAIISRYGSYVIDFWNGIADSNGFIQSKYGAGDGIHLNNAAHKILCDRVLAKSIDLAVPNSGVVTFYENCEYAGSSAGLAVGDYNLDALKAKNLSNDYISSLKVPAGFKVIAYADDNFSGNSTTFTASDNCLSDNGWDNQISSLKVMANGATGLNGTYSLQNRNSNLYMDITGGSTADGAIILQWTGTGGANQKFTLTDVGNGSYSIIGVQSGKAVDISGASIDNLATVLQWTYNGVNNQKFIFIPTDNGYYKLKAVHSGKLVDVTGGSLVAGGTIIQWDDNNQINAQWKLIATTKSASIDGNTDVEKEIVCYPNPSDNKITLQNIPASTTITLFDLNGRALLKATSGNDNEDVNVDISTLNSGAYYIKIDNKESKVIKLLKR